MSIFNKIFGRKTEDHSEDYEKFLYDYFTGPQMIRGRGEEDTNVWNRLKGEELDKAIQKVLDVLPSNEECYMRAASIFKDQRAIEKLKQTADTGKDIHARAFAAKILYDWVGYDKYFQRLDDVFNSNNQWSKTSLHFWIKGLKEEDALKYFWKAMNDPDDFVRFCSYGSIEYYFGIKKFRNDGSEILYFTEQKVFENKELFNSRQEELKLKIQEWKNNNA